MTCPKCGEQNPDNALFCIACGERLNVVEDDGYFRLPPPFTKERFRYQRRDRKRMKKNDFTPDRTFMFFPSKRWDVNYFVVDDESKRFGVIGMIKNDIFIRPYGAIKEFQIYFDGEPVDFDLEEYPKEVSNVEIKISLYDEDIPILEMPLLLAKQDTSSSSFYPMLHMVRTFGKTLHYMMEQMK